MGGRVWLGCVVVQIVRCFLSVKARGSTAAYSVDILPFSYSNHPILPRPLLQVSPRMLVNSSSVNPGGRRRITTFSPSCGALVLEALDEDASAADWLEETDARPLGGLRDRTWCGVAILADYFQLPCMVGLDVPIRRLCLHGR